MDILNPPKCYVDYRCQVHGLEGSDLERARSRFYEKHPDTKGEISKFFNYLAEARQTWSLPFEKIEIRDSDNKKRGNVLRLMISDIEYWIEGGEIRQRKIYMTHQGGLTEEESLPALEDGAPF